MGQNRALAEMLASVLERTERLMYGELRRSHSQKREWRMLHAPISAAIRGRDPAAAREAVLCDIRGAQEFTLGAGWRLDRLARPPVPRGRY